MVIVIQSPAAMESDKVRNFLETVFIIKTSGDSVFMGFWLGIKKGLHV
jgi:hypothetical protein